MVCERCHPQERQKMGILSSVADMLAQEFNDLKDLAQEVETYGPFAACTAVDPSHLKRHNKQHGVRETDEEITIVPDPRMNRRGDPEDKENQKAREKARRAEEARDIVEEKPKPPAIDLLA